MAQRHKGDRHPQTVRVPVDHHAVYADEAKRAGLPVGEYLATRLAELHGLTMPTPAPNLAQPALIAEETLLAS